jgi:hypothetical protein
MNLTTTSTARRDRSTPDISRLAPVRAGAPLISEIVQVGLLRHRIDVVAAVARSG